MKKTVAIRAVAALNSLRNNLRNWYTFYNGYDPIFTWWNEEPYRSLDQALTGYAAFLSERVVGIRAGRRGKHRQVKRVAGGGGRSGWRWSGRRRTRFSTSDAAPHDPGDTSDIVGDPIGREALLSELRSEMIPYTPEELIAIGEKEMAWCENEMKKASRELGYGDDWQKALEHVKNLYVEPGKQPEMIRDLALEAIKFVEDNDLVTVPELARETWRMEMMTPERQLVSPFFLGGEVIQVSFPTNTMAHEQKMMSMRGNNLHFSRATVHHELIPGHHLQGFMTARYKPYRGLFSTPFWSEGRALYWELLLWDMNFREDAREPDRHALLAHAPLRANHLLAQFSPGEDDAAGVHRPARQSRRTRTRQRDRRSAALVRRQLRAALSDRVFARRTAALCVAQRAGWFGQDDQPRISRRDAEGEPHSDRDGARGDHESEADA